MRNKIQVISNEIREILFMGKLQGNCATVEGFLILNEKDPFIVGRIVESNEEYINLEYWYPVIPETVGQYIGKKDKNGKMIFAGHWLTEKVKVDGKMADAVYPVVYSEERSAFCLDMSHFKDGSYLCPILEEDLQFLSIGGHVYDLPLLNTQDPHLNTKSRKEASDE